jgi:hypothetical protein
MFLSRCIFFNFFKEMFVKRDKDVKKTNEEDDERVTKKYERHFFEPRSQYLLVKT